jgi:hypothetical protein
LALDLLENVRLDNGRHGDFDEFLSGLLGARS